MKYLKKNQILCRNIEKYFVKFFISKYEIVADFCRVDFVYKN